MRKRFCSKEILQIWGGGGDFEVSWGGGSNQLVFRRGRWEGEVGGGSNPGGHCGLIKNGTMARTGKTDLLLMKTLTTFYYFLHTWNRSLDKVLK